MPAWPYCLLQQQCSFGGLQLKLLDAPWQRLIRRTTNLFFAGREKKQPRREKPGLGGA